MGIYYSFTCRPVNLSTCLPRLTGPEVSIGEQGIIGIPCLSTCRAGNLSKGKYMSSRHYGYSVLVTCRLVNMSTDRSGLTFLVLDMLLYYM